MGNTPLRRLILGVATLFWFSTAFAAAAGAFTLLVVMLTRIAEVLAAAMGVDTITMVVVITTVTVIVCEITKWITTRK